MTPPVAAKASGVAKRRVAARRPAVTIASSDSTSLVWIQIAAAMPASEIPIAHQPSLRCPRVTPQNPAERAEEAEHDRDADRPGRERRQRHEERGGAEHDARDGDAARVEEAAALAHCSAPLSLRLAPPQPIFFRPAQM